MLKHVLTIRINDELLHSLENLADLIETGTASFARGGLEFFTWVVNNHHENPYFQVLWEEFCKENNQLLKKLKKE